MAVEFTKKRALLVGVNKYENVTPLRFCVKDAVDLAATFRNSLGFGKDDVLTFVDDDPRLPPQRSKIYDQLGRLRQPGNVGVDDLLVFFFSGHGMIGKEDGKDYLLPIEATQYNLERTGIKVEDIASELKETGCNNIVMFIDACREPISGSRGLVSIGEASAEALKRAGIVTFFSCDPKEKSFEIDELMHGAFTHCILEAIKNGEGNTVSELGAYLKNQVPKINEKHGKSPQRPYTVLDNDDKASLPIFFSAVQQQVVLANLEALLSCIGDLFDAGNLDDDYFNKIVEFVDTKDRSSVDREAKKLALIEKLCSRILNQKSFKVAWDAHERRKAVSTAKIDKLGPLE